jgi:Spy/CpxP family protein refolding chaperone
MRKTTIITFALGALALLAGACGMHHRGWGSKDPAERSAAITQHLAKSLDLTAEQKAKVQPLVQALVMERESWRGEGPKALGDLKAQFQAASFDSKAMTQASDARLAKLTKSRDLVLQKLAEFHAILTPEQRAKAAEILGRWETRWAEHSQR